MKLGISRQHASLLIEYARDADPAECCGLLLGSDDRVESIVLAANVADNPNSRFEIDPVNLLAAQKAQRAGSPAVLGYFHSHPNGKPEPSVIDAGNAQPNGQIWLIIAQDDVSAWQALENGALHGRFCPVEIDFTG